MKAPFRIGLLGLGNVGAALAKRLTGDADPITLAAGRPIRLEAIAARTPQPWAPAPLMSPERLLGRGDLDAIVELIGGLEPAHTYINMALSAGRQVITANKQVIAMYGPALASEGTLRFEGSVASAIPIVEMLAESLAADYISSLEGILNGTTNSMLQAMGEGASYGEALADAQRRGLAEADPTADVDAHDPAAKLAILMMLAFRRRIDPSTIERIGIRHLTKDDIAEAAREECVIKLIASARISRSIALRTGGSEIPMKDERLTADVRPRLVPKDHSLARIDGALNAIKIDARHAGTLMLTGPGAGPDAAASAVLADLVRAARAAPASAGAILAGLRDSPIAAVAPPGSDHPYRAVE